VRWISEVLKAALSPIVVARDDSTPSDLRKTGATDGPAKRRERVKPRAVAGSSRSRRQAKPS
jgi:hypothetical protein